MKEITEVIGEFLLDAIPAIILIIFFLGIRYTIAPWIETIAMWMFG